jgi:hypothetical protein
MKRTTVIFLASMTALAADKPRVYVTDSASWETNRHTGGARPQTAEIYKTVRA